MSSVSADNLSIINNCLNKITRHYSLIGACLYGSKVAGYSKPGSDFDIIIVLDKYPHIVKYVYMKQSKIRISALVVDRRSLERDASSAFLGEFVIGRLLHVYEPLFNDKLFILLETLYKKRVIIEEVIRIINSIKVLGNEVIFPLEFIMFSKIKRRSIMYPNALYSYYKTYTGPYAAKNIRAAIAGYRRALSQILLDQKELLIQRPSDSMLQIQEKFTFLKKRDDTYAQNLKTARHFQSLSSYLVHVYAGRKTFQHIVKEAESKIRRHRRSVINLPKFMSCPTEAFLKLPEGIIIIDDKNWLDKVSMHIGFPQYEVLYKIQLGSLHGRSFCYTIRDNSQSGLRRSIVVKELARVKPLKWPLYDILGSYKKGSRFDPISRLGCEYRALRYIRTLGLNSPTIISVVIGKKLLITEYIHGKTILDIVKNYSKEPDYSANSSLYWLKRSGEQIAKIHSEKSTFGNLSPDGLIVSDQDLYITGLEQFNFGSGDPLWDIVYFICSSLIPVRHNIHITSKLTTKFLEGYSENINCNEIKTNHNDLRRYIESFEPVIPSPTANLIKKQISTYLM
jgi:tRNA A-37 threonylcarbamoyl transferase component Bud32/predicted nucleotidyltransferase